MIKSLATSAVAVGVAACQMANAIQYGFHNITGNSATDAAIGETQLFVDVTDEGSGKVRFTFSNTGPSASSITDVYFDDGTLLGIASIINGTGVAFSQGASPADLPGGNSVTPEFVTTAGFLADSDSPPPLNGVNPGESFAIVFNLIGGKTFADAIAALDGGSDLRIGIHVQAFADGESESFINNARVPDGGTTVVLLAFGMFGLGVVARRKC